jgi:Lysophospholipase L1 and related esterases
MKRATFVAIGDSLTYGYPYTAEYSWVRLAGDSLGLTIINKGICGETTADMKRRFANDALCPKPDYVIITGGSNDAFLGAAAREVAGNVAAMADAAGTAGIRPIIGVPPAVDYPEENLLAEYRRLLRSYAGSESLPIIDFYAALADPATGRLRRGLHNDGIHPNTEGYGIMAAAAIAAIAAVTGE